MAQPIHTANAQALQLTADYMRAFVLGMAAPPSCPPEPLDCSQLCIQLCTQQPHFSVPPPPPPHPCQRPACALQTMRKERATPRSTMTTFNVSYRSW